MTSIAELPKPNATFGLGLILPAYKSAFGCVSKIWIPLALGGCLTVAGALLHTIKMEEIDELGGIGIALVIAFYAAYFFLYLVVSAKVSVTCFKMQHPHLNLPNTLFGPNERAAFGAWLEITLASIFILFMLILPLSFILWALKFFTNSALFTSSFFVFLTIIGSFVIYQAIVARYLLGIPMAIADTSSDPFKSDLLG